MKIRITTICGLLIWGATAHAQDLRSEYEKFKRNAETSYSSFRDSANARYAEFLKEAWEWHKGNAPFPLPKEENVVPPMPYQGVIDEPPVEVTPIEVLPVEEEPQPQPIVPIQENPLPIGNDGFTVKFYGADCKVRLPEQAKTKLVDATPNSIANQWERLSCKEMKTALADCLETRGKLKLCDWAYLQFLDELSRNFCVGKNEATLLMAYLYSQSGYQMRLGFDNGDLVMLYGSRHTIYNKMYFHADNADFYPYGQTSSSISISKAKFDGEKPMSLAITSEQKLGTDLSAVREIHSEKYPVCTVKSQVPVSLMAFYDQYPNSCIGMNPMTRWAIYANVPMAQATKDRIYPSLKKSIEGMSEEEAANVLLNWVQTGFEYEYDDKVWGHDRAFFAEESLYYPYCDCEDRSILFSRLVRDLLGLDVALVYYPGHLATAVKFGGTVNGDAVIIDGQRFVICDPTYIGAPVGMQMPNLDYGKVQAIALNQSPI